MLDNSGLLKTGINSLTPFHKIRNWWFHHREQDTEAYETDAELLVAQKRKEKEQAMETALKKAHHCNIDAMEYVIVCYYNGWDGFPQDHNEAFRWAKYASAAGSTNAAALVGDMLLHGEGVEKDVQLGTTYLGKAAADGNMFAALELREALDLAVE